MEDLAADPLRFATDCCLALGVTPPESAERLPESINVASEPRNYYIARAGRVTGDCLRSAQSLLDRGICAAIRASSHCSLASHRKTTIDHESRSVTGFLN